MRSYPTHHNPSFHKQIFRSMLRELISLYLSSFTDKNSRPCSGWTLTHTEHTHTIYPKCQSWGTEQPPYAAKIQLTCKSCEIKLACNISFAWCIILKFCTEHGSNTAMLCAKFENYTSIAKWLIDRHDLERFELKTDFGRIWCIVTSPEFLEWLIVFNHPHGSWPGMPTHVGTAQLVMERPGSAQMGGMVNSLHEITWEHIT